MVFIIGFQRFFFSEQGTHTRGSGTKRSLPVGISLPHFMHLPYVSCSIRLRALVRCSRLFLYRLKIFKNTQRFKVDLIFP